MPPAMMKIGSVEARSAYRLSVSWTDGSRGIIDFGATIKDGGVFSALAEVRSFAAVRIGENGRVIEWPEPSDALGYPLIDIDAESLYLMYRSQKDNEVTSRIRAAVRYLAGKAYLGPENVIRK